MLSLQLAPYLARHRGAYDFVFANAPRPATGDPEEGIPPEVRTYEWWGEAGVAYDDAWKAGFDGLDTALADLVSSGPSNPNPKPNPNPKLKPNPHPHP